MSGRSSSIWWPRYVGDYQRKTAHLSLIEHGVYAILLDHYYSTGKPLPADASAYANAGASAGASASVLHRICRAFEPEEKAAVQSVIEQFFTLEDDGYHNAKADEELATRSKLSEKRSRAAGLRHGKVDANACASACAIAPTSTTTSTYKDSPDGESTPYPQSDDLEDHGDFEEWWRQYPSGRKQSKPKCREKYIRLVKSGQASPADLLAGAMRYAAAGYDNSKFVKGPLVWLNQGCWEDEDIPPPSDKVSVHRHDSVTAAFDRMNAELASRSA